MEVSFSNSFKQVYKRSIAGAVIEQQFWQKVASFMFDPYLAELRTHRLLNEEKLWSFSIGGNYTVIFYFTGEEQQRAVFVDFYSPAYKKLKEKNGGNHLYWWGLVGIIPLIGGVLGFVFAMLGIFKYRNWKLVLIGALALLPTVGVYGFLFYSMFSSNTIFSKGFEVFSRYQLNDLVKSIEFYKLTNGVYPDSLEQAQTGSSMVTLNDPLMNSFSMGGKSGRFNYQKVGDRYTIFSSGPDRKPNTADDIYPDLKIMDSTKIGLIRK